METRIYVMRLSRTIQVRFSLGLPGKEIQRWNPEATLMELTLNVTSGREVWSGRRGGREHQTRTWYDDVSDFECFKHKNVFPFGFWSYVSGGRRHLSCTLALKRLTRKPNPLLACT